MSMIYGFINLDGRPADPAILMNMESALSDRKHDVQSTLINANVAMGFKNQYITEESHFEDMPYYDTDTGLFFVCDAIIDNREELAALLGLRLTKEIPDSWVIFEAYKKWGEGCTRYLLGDFAFVVYDSKNRRVQLFRDHMGQRLLYYRQDGSRIFFSTLIKPLIDPWGNKRKPELDEKYLVHFLCMNDLRQEIYPGSTIYKDICYVLPASCLSSSKQSVKNEVYWDPMDIPPDRRLKKSDYVESFKSIYTDAVRCRLRTDGEVGVMLSGGLDSSSVACIAASLLQEQNKQLYTYTSVPMQGFINWESKQWNADESDLVRIIHAAYPNIVGRFVDAEGKNSINVSDQMLSLNEQPYKFIANSFWLTEIFRAASDDGCRVLLGGSFGNGTVSYGMYWDILFEHFMRFRLVSFIRDVNAFCRNINVSRKEFISKIRGLFFRSVFPFNRTPNATGAVRNEYLVEYGVKRNLRALGMTNKPLHRDKDARKLMLHPTYLQQCYSLDAKHFCFTGVCKRDPTGDKRVVEFCMRLPYDCFFDKTTGQDRSLIKRAMTGYIPDEILNERRRGLQAADWLERLEPQWDDFIREFQDELCQAPRIFKYVNLSSIMDLANRSFELRYDNNTSNDVRNIITINNCKKFIDML